MAKKWEYYLGSILFTTCTPTNRCSWLVCSLPFSPRFDLQTMSSLPTLLNCRRVSTFFAISPLGCTQDTKLYEFVIDKRIQLISPLCNRGTDNYCWVAAYVSPWIRIPHLAACSVVWRSSPRSHPAPPFPGRRDWWSRFGFVPPSRFRRFPHCRTWFSHRVASALGTWKTFSAIEHSPQESSSSLRRRDWKEFRIYN